MIKMIRVDKCPLMMRVFAVVIGFTTTLSRADDGVEKEQSSTNQIPNISDVSHEGNAALSIKDWRFGRGATQEQIDSMIEISNSVRKVTNALPTNSYPTSAMQNFQIKNMTFRFADQVAIHEYIKSEDKLEKEGFKESLQQAQTALEAICKELREYMWMEGGNADVLLWDTVVALQEIDMAKKNITNTVDIVNYMLAEQELYMQQKTPYGAYGYLREHSVTCMKDLLHAYDSTSNRDMKKFIMRLWNVHDLPPDLEVELINRLDFSDPNEEPNISIMVALRYVGGEQGRFKIEEFLQKGPADMHPSTVKFLNDWEFWRRVRKRKEREKGSVRKRRLKSVESRE